MTQTALTQPSQNQPAADGTAPQAGPRFMRSSPEDVAYRTAARVREALLAAGFDADRDFPALHGDVTSSGEPFITLGRFRPGVAERFAALLLIERSEPRAAGAAARAAAPSAAGPRPV